MIEEFKINSSDQKVQLFGTIKKPLGHIKGIVVVIHGMAEHRKRYYRFMDYLVDNNYMAVIYDQRGHGQSVKEKADLGYFYEEKAEKIVEDVNVVIGYVKEKYPNLPITIFSHSMGTLVSRSFLKNHDELISKIIFSGAPSKNSLVHVGIILANLLEKFKGKHYRSQFLHHLVLPGKDNNWLSTDHNEVTKYDDDELCGYIFTLNGFKNLFHLVKYAYQNNYQVKNKRLPIYFIAGSNDPIIKNQKSFLQTINFFKNLGYQNVTYKLYPNKGHELLNEDIKDDVYQDILNFINKNE